MRGELTQNVDERHDHRHDLSDEADEEAHGHDFEDDLPDGRHAYQQGALSRDRRTVCVNARGRTKTGTYWAVLPKDHDALEDEEVRDPDGDDREHRTGEDKLLASAVRSATIQP